MTDLILGTAGHIDHGKTTLTRALTGTDTDRLPEEKKRGITIELGYAHLELPPFRLGIVDVPGHEKFVRQMLAGATGMDLAMLVVAGDDSVNQQTREHLDILRMLDLPAGVIALTKCDLSDDDWLSLVEDEIRQLVAGTFLEDAPIVRTSAKTGRGIPELKEALTEAAKIAAESERQNRLQGPFRMPIDRSFTIDGHGTVVTGSVSSGSLKLGDQLQLQPGNIDVRVRGLQNHDSKSDEVHRGQRAAVNLAGIHHLEIFRGHELCTAGHLVPSNLVTVELSILSSAVKPFKDRTRVRFHIGTAELLGNVRLLQGTEIQPGESGLAQIFLNESAVASWNQPFVIRRQSPVETIGGGRILHPSASKIKKATEVDLQMIRSMKSKDGMVRASASIYLSDDPGWSAEQLPRTAGIINTATTQEQLIQSGDLVPVKLSVTRNALIHKQRFAEIGDRVVKSLARMHEQNPLRYSHPRSALDTEFAYMNQPELVDAVIKQLNRDKILRYKQGTVGLTGYGPKLSKNEQHLLEQIIAQMRNAGLQTPGVKDLQKSADKNKQSVPQLLQLGIDNEDLIRVGDDFVIHRDVMETVKEQLSEAITKTGGLTLSEIRQLLDTSRKYAVPICEYLDSIGFTARNGDKRVLASLA